MKRLMLTPVLPALLIAGLAGSASAHAVPTSQCGREIVGSGAPPQDHTYTVTAENLSCAKARKIARAAQGNAIVYHNVDGGYVTLKHYPGWRCVTHPKTSNTVCTLKSEHVIDHDLN